MDRVCIYPFLFHMESFLGTNAAIIFISILSDKDSESVNTLIHVRKIQGDFSNGECEFFNENRLVV